MPMAATWLSMYSSRDVAGLAVSTASASGELCAVLGLTGARHHRRHRQQPVGVVDGEPLHDHPAHRQPHHVGSVHTDGVEHGQRVARHVGERVLDALELRREPDVAVVEAHDLVAAGRRTSRTTPPGS